MPNHTNIWEMGRNHRDLENEGFITEPKGIPLSDAPNIPKVVATNRAGLLGLQKSIDKNYVKAEI